MRRAILITTAAAALLAGTALASAQGFVHQAGWAIQQGALAAEGDTQPMLVRHRHRSHWRGPHWRGAVGAPAHTPPLPGHDRDAPHHGRNRSTAQAIDPAPRRAPSGLTPRNSPVC